MKYGNFFFAEKGLVMLFGEVGGEVVSDSDDTATPTGIEMDPERTGAIAMDAAADLNERAAQLSNTPAEKAKAYCETIQSAVQTQIGLMDKAEQATPKGDPRQDKPPEGNSEEAKEKQREWQKRMDEWNEKKAEYDNQILRLTITLARSFNSDTNSKMVMDNTLKQEGVAEGASAKNMSARLTPSVLAAKFYTNYKIHGEKQGGWGVKEDLSDVPEYVENGTLNLKTFKMRTDKINSVFSDVAQKEKILQEKYC
ncbi:MAG: hypothetical protein V1880_01340 [Patescibacteria group bacterium]